MNNIERKNYEHILKSVKIFKEATNTVRKNMDSAEIHLNNLLTEKEPGELCMPVSDSWMDIKVCEYLHPIKEAIKFFEDSIDVRRTELQDAFDSVTDANNWKNPINAWILKREVDITFKAIEYFTGTKGRIIKESGAYVQIAADGYYGGPCN